MPEMLEKFPPTPWALWEQYADGHIWKFTTQEIDDLGLWITRQQMHQSARDWARRNGYWASVKAYTDCTVVQFTKKEER